MEVSVEHFPVACVVKSSAADLRSKFTYVCTLVNDLLTAAIA